MRGRVHRCDGPVLLRFEPAFVLAPCDIVVRWSDERGATVSEEAIRVDRDTIATFCASPASFPGGRLTCSAWYGSAVVLGPAAVDLPPQRQSRLVMSDMKRRARDSYHAVRDDVINLAFEEMLMVARDRIASSGAGLIYVTGSVGKTTTKELIGHVLQQRGAAYHSTDSWNFTHELCAQIVLNAEWARTFVFEVAVGDHLGLVGRLLPPSVFVFTHLGSVHTAQYATVTELGYHKASASVGMGSSGTAVINADVPSIGEACEEMWSTNRERGMPNVIRFRAADSLGGADVAAHAGTGQRTLTLLDRDQHRSVEGADEVLIRNPGNVAASYGACHTVGVDMGSFVQELRSFRPAPHRLDVQRFGATTLIDDAYNANPVSFRSFIETLRQRRGRGERVCAVVGEMADLGVATLREHVALVASLPGAADDLFLVGPTFERCPPYSGDGECAYVCDAQALMSSERFKVAVARCDAIAVKGSYCTNLLQVVDALRDTFSAA
jgi:UDP-N-acetylmuramoyl-tripeptide--D-alanyl-D-alanine ligase